MIVADYSTGHDRKARPPLLPTRRLLYADKLSGCLGAG